MAGAFQASAFQDNAFQVDAVVVVATTSGYGGWGAGLHGPATPLSKVKRFLSDFDEKEEEKDEPLFTVEEVLAAPKAEVVTAPKITPIVIPPDLRDDLERIKRTQAKIEWQRMLDEDDEEVLMLVH